MAGLIVCALTRRRFRFAQRITDQLARRAEPAQRRYLLAQMWQLATPGRLLDHAQQRTVDLSHVEILVLDEADRMLDMGFIHDIRRVLIFYLWVPTLNGKTSVETCTELFEKAHIVVASGSAYGEFGEGFFRFSLTVSDDRLDEAMDRLRNALG